LEPWREASRGSRRPERKNRDPSEKNGVGKIEEEKRKKKTIFTYARPEFGTICAALFAYCWENQNVGNLVGTESGIKKDALLLG
jgi:hypothetical protein